MSVSEFADRAVEIAVTEACSEVIVWCGRDAVVQRYIAELRRYCLWLSDDARARAFHAAVRVPHSVWRDYRSQLLTTEIGSALVGVRFHSGRANEAFVQVYARDFSIDRNENASSFLAACLEAYAVFKPKSVRVRIRPEAELSGCIEESVDFMTVAGHLAELRARPIGAADVSVRPARDASWYSAYRQAYDDYHLEHPELVGVVDPEDEDDITDNVGSGYVYEIRAGGHWAGIMTVKPAYRDGMRGYLLLDELLMTRFRGRRLAVTAQQKLIRYLDHPRRTILFGSIAPTNTPSLATALRVGRQPVSRCTFLKPATGG